MTSKHVDAHAAPELWGGIECTVNRVGDTYHDQLDRSGHAHRLSDLERFNRLGVRTLRYPFLWERIAPDGPECADWIWSDARWLELRRLGIRTIVGLVHHGSGPRGTSLLEDSFVTGLTAYARAFARRYPDAEAYTPINEPCTTARFSALYGHWYPHGRSDRDFVRAMLVQCRATVLAMRAIRETNPAARLVQTEDIGRTLSTPPLTYQAEFQNERRWLAIDLLFGRVTRHHAVWPYLQWAGVQMDDVRWFADHPCPPDVVGVNYYLTSDRFLDHRLELYPPHLHGGNGRDAYADTEAVRIPDAGLIGHEQVLLDTFDRYRVPVALTEVHAGGTREDQLCWFHEGWMGACRARQRGVPVVGVATWALLGSYDWDCLLTRCNVHYEPGAFDVRESPPRLTALGRLVQSIGAGTAPPFQHVSTTRGWWHQPRESCGVAGVRR